MLFDREGEPYQPRKRPMSSLCTECRALTVESAGTVCNACWYWVTVGHKVAAVLPTPLGDVDALQAVFAEMLTQFFPGDRYQTGQFTSTLKTSENVS